MAARILAHNWAATPLGPAEHWPQSLRTAVDMVLGMPAPATILWGPQHVQIYNDAYIGIARDRHPGLLGLPVAEGWRDIYEAVLVPLLDAAHAGRATRLADYAVPLAGPDGRLEDRVFDTDWSPLRDETGAVAGALQTLTEATNRHRAETSLRDSEGHQAFLLAFSDTLRAELDADAVAERAIGMLSEEMGLDRCYLETYRLDEDRADITHQTGNDRAPPMPQSIRPSDFPEAFRMVFDRTLVVEDVPSQQGLSDADRRNMLALGFGAIVAPTLRKGPQHPLWVLVAVSAQPRRWTPGEIALIEEAAERTWAAMERARAEAALRESEERLRTMADNVPVLIWETDESGATSVNGHYLDFFGVSAAEIEGMGWANFLHPDDAQRYLDVYSEGYRNRTSYSHDCRFRRADGQYRWLRNSGGPVGARRYVGCSLDVTDNVLAAQALRESEQALASDLANAERLRSLSERLMSEESFQGLCCITPGEHDRPFT